MNIVKFAMTALSCAALSLPASADVVWRPDAKTEFTVSLDAQGIEWLKNNGGVSRANVGLWVPGNFDPSRPWNILLVSVTSDGGTSVGAMDAFLGAARSVGGWIVMAADGTTSPGNDNIRYRWATMRAGLRALEAQWPAVRTWPVATGGFSGGAKWSGWLGGALMAEGHPLVGMWMGGCNEDMATYGFQDFHPGERFLGVPIFLSVGDSDDIAPLADVNRYVVDSMKQTGFSQVYLELFNGGHNLYQPHLEAGLRWFMEHAAAWGVPETARPANDDFASPVTIYGESGTVRGDNVRATMETWEQMPSSLPSLTGSVWFQWTAPSSGRVQFDTVGSEFDTVLGVYVGNAVHSLYEVAVNDDLSEDVWGDSSVSFQAIAGTTYQIAVYGYYYTSGSYTLNWSLVPIRPVSGRFDDDERADIAVFDGGDWEIESSSLGRSSIFFGSGDCIPVPADYDGDGTTDLSVYDTVTGDWWIRYSAGLNGRSWICDNFGSLTCKPFPADYDGDGLADLSVWDGRTGDWFIRFSSGGWKKDNFGSLSCIPVPADYDGDGKADLSVRDNATGDWWIRYTRGLNGRSWLGDNFGSTVCDPYPADYDGDGLADLSVYDQQTGDWFVRYSSGRGPNGLSWTKDNFGMKTCIPVPADYDGDGLADFAVYDTAYSTFWVRYSGGGWTSVGF